MTKKPLTEASTTMGLLAGRMNRQGRTSKDRLLRQEGNMTERELNQLHWINKEIKVLAEQKQTLESGSYAKGQEITGMPFVGGTSDKTCDRAVAIQEINELYEIKLKELYLVRGRIERYINGIQDAEMRLIIRLRCINNMSWEDISAEIMLLDENGEVVKQRSRTTIYRKFKNFLKNSENAHNAQ